MSSVRRIQKHVFNQPQAVMPGVDYLYTSANDSSWNYSLDMTKVTHIVSNTCPISKRMAVTPDRVREWEVDNSKRQPRFRAGGEGRRRQMTGRERHEKAPSRARTCVMGSSEISAIATAFAGLASGLFSFVACSLRRLHLYSSLRAMVCLPPNRSGIRHLLYLG